VAGLSARRLAERRLLPDGPLRPRRTLLPDRGGRGSGPLFPRLQPRPGGADHASPTRPLPIRHGLSPALLLPAATGPPADPQGPADLPPRPGPVVPVFDLLRTPRLLFPEHPAAGICRPISVLAKPGEFSQPVGDGADPLDIHEPVHFPSALTG